MQWKELLKVLVTKWQEYIVWLMANMGGILISYLAVAVIWMVLKRSSLFMPGYDIFLVTGAISLAVSGVSYIRLKSDQQKEIGLSSVLIFLWILLLMSIFGILICLGLECPSASFRLWIISIVIFFGCMICSSLIWLNEQGIEMDKEKEPETPPEPKGLAGETNALPKI
ncbi:MAG: hypothetical protein WCY23_00500 [Candidatus Omnitrophota bacterium]